MRARALWTCAAFALGFALAIPAAALDLDAAKRQGLVGERIDGYVGSVAPNPTAEVSSLVADVNARRKAAYAQIAAKNGSPVEAVAAIAGQKLVDRAAPGDWIDAGNGNWYQKR